MSSEELFTKVNLFLTTFKECVSDGLVSFSEVNAKTTRFLRAYGITVAAMHNFIIENIEEKHYFRGPSEHHRASNRTVTEFGLVWDEIKVYVKLELIAQENNFVAAYMSFHPREQEIDCFPLDYKGEVI